jgi:hypothetical protein
MGEIEEIVKKKGSLVISCLDILRGALVSEKHKASSSQT